MSDTVIRCPDCGTEIEVSEVLAAQLRSRILEDVQTDHHLRLEEARRQATIRAREQVDLEFKDVAAQLTEAQEKADLAAERELQLRRKTRELESLNQAQAESIRAEVAKELGQRREQEIARAVADVEKKATASNALVVADLKQSLTEQRAKADAAMAAELQLRKDKTRLEERSRELDLEVQRKVDAEKAVLEASIRKSAAEEQDLRLKQKEKTIEDLRQALDDAKRRSELGSQEQQGEVLEVDIQAAMERQFPLDRIEPVRKGQRGADITQVVVDGRGNACGTIIWETKNTRHWQRSWIDKLKQDQRESGASLAVLVSVVLPTDVQQFGRVDGIWVSDRQSWPALAVALREQLMQVTFAHAASEGKNEKMDLLYQYLAGDQFRTRVQGIVEAFSALKEQLDRERRAMERLWKEREKQIERVMLNTVGMYGEMRGIIGASMPRVESLELDAGLLLESGPDANDNS